MNLDLGKLPADAFKKLQQAVKAEKARRSKKNPEKNEPPQWSIPNSALRGNVDARHF